MLNEQGFITDGSGENVFIVRDGVADTPPTQAGCLDGITRGSVIPIARDLGYEVREENLVRSDLYNADECFFSGTAAEITPIREVDDRRGRGGTPWADHEGAPGRVLRRDEGRDRTVRRLAHPRRLRHPPRPLVRFDLEGTVRKVIVGAWSRIPRRAPAEPDRVGPGRMRG